MGNQLFPCQEENCKPYQTKRKNNPKSVLPEGRGAVRVCSPAVTMPLLSPPLPAEAGGAGARWRQRSAEPGGVPALVKTSGCGSPGHNPGHNPPSPALPARAHPAMVTASLPGGMGAEPPHSAPVKLQSTARAVGARRPPELGSGAQVWPAGSEAVLRDPPRVGGAGSGV